jgi:long-chain acyl-CoA synthetase
VRLRWWIEHGLRRVSLVNYPLKYANIYSLFTERVTQFRARDDGQPRNVFYFRSDDQWKGVSWDRFDEEARNFATALLSMGLPVGTSVAILMGNVPEWPISDLGTIMAGGVGVGLYPSSSAEQCEYIIRHSGAEFLLVDTAAQLEKVMSLRDRLPKLKTIIVLDEGIAGSDAGVISYQEFINRGREERQHFDSLLRQRSEGAQADDIAIMVYTSGTTGPPKGACLSHRYILNSVESLRQTIPLFETDVSFSYLPFCHVAERISGLYNRLYSGASAYFVDNLARLGEYMLEVKPTVFASLPRFFEKIHARIIADLDLVKDEERIAFADALNVGRQISKLRQAREAIPSSLQEEFRDKAPVLNRVKEYFGGRIRLATSGGAPLPLEVAEFFDATGMPILQAYGLTENVCVAFNRPDNYKFGTVGPPLPGCTVEIAEDGEILVRSEMMFSGYYKAPEQTAEMFRDGWLLTGDLGEIDADGFLKITGRKKELIVTSTGKKVAPALIENMLKEHHLISQAMVYGEGKSYLVALLTLNPIEAGEYARARGITENPACLARSDEIATLVKSIVDQVNARVSTTESIKKFVVLERDFEIEKDEITPTGKIKRDVVTERYGQLIQSLYA